MTLPNIAFANWHSDLPPTRSALFARAERSLFALTIVAAASMMWLAPHLPMIDLAQHAGQVALWRDLILGQSPWSDLVRINLLTPYLVGYGMMLPFSFLFSMETTTRIVLTLAFMGFIGASMLLRREFAGDRRLDWLSLLSFYGFAWKWGFLTFLVASSLGLVFVVLAYRQARAPDLKGAIGLILAGLVLLFAHGLVFLGMGWIGGILALYHAKANRAHHTFTRLAPYAALTISMLAFRLATAQMDGAMQWDGLNYGIPIYKRLGFLLLCISDMGFDTGLVLSLLTVGALAAPLLLGLKFNTNRAAIVAGAGFVSLLAILPVDGFQTGQLFPRFALFVAPFMAISFSKTQEVPSPAWRSRLPMIAVIGLVWSVLSVQAVRIAAFAQESAPFASLLAKAQPGKRALALIYDAKSAAAENAIAYIHFPAWYQADKHGFVDFNFAVFHPQVIRFRADRKPAAGEALSWTPENFGWDQIDMHLYDYYFVRGNRERITSLLATAPCHLETIVTEAEWTLLGRGDCDARFDAAP